MVSVNVLMLVVNNIRLTGVGRCWIDFVPSNTIAGPTYVPDAIWNHQFQRVFGMRWN